MHAVLRLVEDDGARALKDLVRHLQRLKMELLADLAARESGELTGEGTVIVLERSTRSDEPTAPEGWDITDRRDYGETAVYYIEPAESAEPAEPVESAD